MRRLLILVLALTVIGVACSSESEEGSGVTEDSDAPGTTVPIPEDAVVIPDLQISVVEFGEDGFLDVVNIGAEPADVSPMYLSQFPTVLALSDVIEEPIAVGASARIPASAMGGLSADGGEIALLTSPDFEDPDSMVGYVQWGTGGVHGPTATAAGIWPEGATVIPDPQFNSIELFGDPADPQNWS